MRKSPNSFDRADPQPVGDLPGEIEPGSRDPGGEDRKEARPGIKGSAGGRCDGRANRAGISEVTTQGGSIVGAVYSGPPQWNFGVETLVGLATLISKGYGIISMSPNGHRCDPVGMLL